MGSIENVVFKSPSIAAFVFIAAVKCLLSHSLAMTGDTHTDIQNDGKDV
jgi:hypothetical protein